MPRITGSETLSLPRRQVWELLNDPETLGAAIPGCHGLEREGDGSTYRTSIAVAVGAVKGVYEGTVTYADIEAPGHCTIKVAARGDKGTIDGSGAIDLAETGDGTEVGYRGDFKLTGPVAGIGQRLAPGVSRKMIVETLHNLERLGSPQPGSDAPAADAPSEAQSAGPAATGEPARAAPRPLPEPFNPLSVPAWVRVSVPLGIGLILGFLIGRIL